MTEPESGSTPSQTPIRRGQDDFSEVGKKHPYLIYIYLVVGLFLFLILMGFLAVNNGWIPSRGI